MPHIVCFLISSVPQKMTTICKETQHSVASLMLETKKKGMEVYLGTEKNIN